MSPASPQGRRAPTFEGVDGVAGRLHVMPKRDAQPLHDRRPLAAAADLRHYAKYERDN